MPDDLFRRVKAAAALQGMSLKDWLTNLLRREVGATPLSEPRAQSPEQGAEQFIAGASDASHHSSIGLARGGRRHRPAYRFGSGWFCRSEDGFAAMAFCTSRKHGAHKLLRRCINQ